MNMYLCWIDSDHLLMNHFILVCGQVAADHQTCLYNFSYFKKTQSHDYVPT